MFVYDALLAYDMICTHRARGLRDAVRVIVHGDDVHRVILRDERYSWASSLAMFDNVNRKFRYVCMYTCVTQCAHMIVSSCGGGANALVIRYLHPSAVLRNLQTDYHIASSLLALANAVEVRCLMECMCVHAVY